MIVEHEHRTKETCDICLDEAREIIGPRLAKERTIFRGAHPHQEGDPADLRRAGRDLQSAELAIHRITTCVIITGTIDHQEECGEADLQNTELGIRHISAEMSVHQEECDTADLRNTEELGIRRTSTEIIRHECGTIDLQTTGIARIIIGKSAHSAAILRASKIARRI
jgi:hypothetical protein